MINTGYVKVGEIAKRIMDDILKTSRISCGKYVSQLETEYANKHNVKHAIAVGSGTEADIIALLALKEKGYFNYCDEVIVPATCFISVANAVIYAGFKPVFVDTDPFNMNLDELESAISDKTGAIIAVHFGGFPLDMERLLKIAGSIPVIEDCACAHGTIANGEIAGSQGRLSTWSLYVAHIVTAGGGGIIGTNDDSLAELAYSIRAYGRSCTCKPCLANISGKRCEKRFKDSNDMRFLYQRMGLNSRMTEMEAAIGLDQMGIYDNIINKRIDNFNVLNNKLHISNSLHYGTFPHHKNALFKTSPIFFPIILPVMINRNKVTEYLENKGIETRNLYACIPTQQPAYHFHPQSRESFPKAERLGNQGFYVGIHQGLSDDDIDYLAENIIKAIERV
jgi:dTDP-4-amino-4,6-dideoxygalactose transaminase